MTDPTHLTPEQVIAALEAAGWTWERPTVGGQAAMRWPGSDRTTAVPLDDRAAGYGEAVGAVLAELRAADFVGFRARWALRALGVEPQRPLPDRNDRGALGEAA